MIKPINKDILTLNKKAALATLNDLSIGKDLLDTLNANADKCVGMAANMIGANKAIIAVNIGILNLVLYNPKIITKSGPYDTQEGCLSLQGVRPVKRFNKITVEYFDSCFVKHIDSFNGYIAQIIQHEIDHTNGIII